MSRQEPHKRPARARTAVKTYNLKALTNPSRKRRLNKRDAGALREPRPSMSPDETSDTGTRASSPANQLHESHSSTSSDLTSPMPSPNLSALGTSLTATASAALEMLESSDNEASPPLYDCFNTHVHPKGHFYSANELFARGVWIGYLTQDRYNEPFRKLLSFNDLKTNFRKFSSPVPPTISGTARELRAAICRGCIGDDSTVITLREIQFVQNVKLVVMPLDGDDEAGMFCIMVPQPNDRSLHGVQCYRPYEYLNGGRGDSFVNRFVLLTHRNTSRDTRLLDTVRAVLSADELNTVARRTAKRLRVDSGSGPGPISPLSVAQRSSSIPTIDQPRDDNGDENIQSIASKESTPNLPAHSSPDPEHTDHISDHISPETADRTPVAIPHSPQRSTVAPDAPEIISGSPAATNHTQIIPLELTDEQARRVSIIWLVNDDGLEYEFVHTIDECQSLNGLFNLLQEEAETIPAVATILAETKMWRLTYQLADRRKKAIVTRKGTEIAFDRLQATLAQSPVWAENSSMKMDIELTALRRPLDPAAAT